MGHNLSSSFDTCVGCGMILKETFAQQTKMNFELKKLPEKPAYLLWI
jgi:hypothetical protein